VTGGATASVGGEKERLHWAINVGADLGASSEAYATTVGSAALVSASAAIDLAEPLLIGAELGTRLDLTGGGGWNEDPVEAHLFSTWSGERGLVATIGGGSGIVPGAGAPDVRALLVVGYRHPGAPKVRDQDQDGLSDELDRCPTDPEDADRYEDEDGCPDLDNDDDGISDIDDECPKDPEIVNGFEDGDGCPDDPYAKVDMAKGEIIIAENVYFETGTATLKPASARVLDSVARLLTVYTSIEAIEVQGHTDNRGEPDKNLVLSQQRADAVVAYLMGKGIDAARLIARGYGDTQPLVPDAINDSEHAKNRRVQFLIVSEPKAE
jgi:outer membrane protein OmpA-like peptidoglycan-associated protein